LIHRLNPYFAVFIFPTAWTVIEYLLYTPNPNGTWGSLAYTQTTFLPVVQMASITGIWGIVFLLGLFSSWISFLWNCRTRKGYLIKASLLPLGLLLTAFCFGVIRLAQQPVGPTFRVGIFATDQNIQFFKTQKAEEALPVIEAYAKKIGLLAAKSVDVVVLPEKMVGVTDEYIDEAKKIFSQTARDNRLTVIVGINILGSMPWKNRAWVFTPDGQLSMEYDKHHLVQGWESGKYEAGEKLGIFSAHQSLWGVLICKDNDFPSYSGLYGAQGVGLMFSPAWDFVHDAEYHFRMAMMRAVENGYTLVRSTKEGYSTISDSYGRIIFSKATFDSGEILDVAETQSGSGRTFYSRTGDWFAWFAIFLLLFCGIFFCIIVVR
jgi:apolipoprotein N-acyltransferase